MIRSTRLGQLALGFLVLLAGSTSLPAADILYVSYYDSDKIEMFDTSGNDLGTFASSNLSSPWGLAFDPSGNLFVSNYTADSISKFSATGSFLNSLGDPTISKAPTGLAIDSSGAIYVASEYNNSISKYGSNGTLQKTFPAHVYGPSDMAFDSSGNLYVISGTGGDVKRFDSSGNYDTGFVLLTGFTAAYGLTIDSSGSIYVASYSGIVRKYNPNGSFSTITNANFNGLNGLTIDSQGNLYVASYAGNNICKFDASGNFLGTWSTGNNSGPAYIAIRSVPEPSTYALGAIATGVMAAIARRRKARKG